MSEPLPQAYSARVLCGWNEANSIQAEWNELFQQASFPQVFYSHAWIGTVCDTLIDSRKLRVLTLWGGEPGETLMALVPFFEVAALGGKGLWPASAHSGDLFDPLLRQENPALLSAFWTALEGLQASYQFVWFPLLSSRFCQAPLGPPEGMKWGAPVCRARTPNLYLERPEGLDFDTFLKESMRRKSRQNLGRQIRKLEERGEVLWEILREPETVGRFIPEIESIERESWKGRDGLGLFSNKQVGAFYRRVLPRLADEGILEITCLRVGGFSVAYEMTFFRDHTRLVHNQAFLPDYASHSPGLLLLVRNLERVFAEGVARVDFLQGDLEFKRRFTNQRQDLFDMAFFAPTFWGKVNAAVFHWLTRKRKKR